MLIVSSYYIPLLKNEGELSMKKLELAKVLSGILTVGLLLSGCSSNATSLSSSTASSAPKKIIVGTSGTFKPYTYLDDKGNVVGYEVDVLNAVNKLLPQYKFEYQTMDFPNILISLGSNKVDIAANQFEKNPDRESKYLFSGESYTTFILRITVKKDRTDINSIKDLEGKNVQVNKGSNDAYVLETYNKSHNNAIKLIYSSADNATTVKNIEEGRIDAIISITRVVQDLNKTYGEKLKTVGDPIAASNTYFIYRKQDTALQADIDKALKTLRENGTLSEISKKDLGGDYTTND